MATKKRYTISYYYALGKFVNHFSSVERVLHYFFHKFAKIEPDVASAIKRGMKASELISIIKGLLVVNKFKAESVTEANELFTQFAAIAEFRDRVIHRGARELANGSFFSSNVATMKSLESYEEATFTIDDVKRASADLQRIFIRMQIAAGELPRDAFRRRLFAPWRYKPVRLSTPHRQPQTKPPKR